MFGGKKIRTKKGKEIILMSPAAKGKKYAAKLSLGEKRMNDGRVKVDKDTKEPVKLTNTQAAYRSGYLDARRDNADAYKYKEWKAGNPKYPNKPKRRPRKKKQ